MIKVCFIIPSLSGGGAETQLHYLSEFLMENDVKLDVIYRNEGPKGQAVFVGDVRYHKLRTKGNYNPKSFIELYRLLHHIQPQVVQTWIIQSDVLFGILNKFLNVKWLVREANVGSNHKGFIKKFLREQLVKNSNVLVANSPLGQKHWSRLYPTKLILNGVKFPDKLEKVAVDNDYILYVGRLTPHKNVDSLILAFAKSAAVASYDLVICGDGPSKLDLIKLSRELGIESRVKFTGFLPTEDVAAYMNGTRLFCLLSDYEGMPNVVVEAMMAESPVLLSSSSSHRSLFTDRVATFVEQKSINEIANKIDLLLMTDNQEQVSRAKLLAEEFSIAVMGNKYLEVYKNMVGTSAL